ncbi:MAG: hypothetical protein OEU26_32795, partial [Candidatus Tectomicrobia bacterium]|nr:hypothetical protein [Candidatus Tectomicrobia bacterium]
ARNSPPEIVNSTQSPRFLALSGQGSGGVHHAMLVRAVKPQQGQDHGHPWPLEVRIGETDS